MKHRKIWQLLLTILLMGVMFAGCASAGTKTVNNIEARLCRKKRKIHPVR